MTKTTASILLWAPRIAGIALALFLSLFALDAFDGRSFFGALPGFLIHLTPALLVFAVVALAWRMPIVGAVAFPIFALGYAVMVGGRADWIAVIAGPLAIIGVLFLVSWGAQAMSRAGAP